MTPRPPNVDPILERPCNRSDTPFYKKGNFLIPRSIVKIADHILKRAFEILYPVLENGLNIIPRFRSES